MTYLDPQPSVRPSRRRRSRPSWRTEVLVVVAALGVFSLAACWLCLGR